MFNFCSLYSGSSGNSLFVESENTKLLVDAGVSSKKIEEALANLEIDPTSIDGILITHEHSDHVQGLGTFAKKFNLPVFVNEKTLDGTEEIISAASCTTNCLAPVLRIIDYYFKIKKGYMTTVHAYTNDQATLDIPHKKGFQSRRGRAAASNIVPTSTGAASAIGKVLPNLEGKLDGIAMRVPVTTGSVIDLSLELEKNTTVEEINKAFEINQNETIQITKDPIVSSDIIGSHIGALVDAGLTNVITVDGKQLVKVVAWYDNEMGYSTQMVRLAKYVGEEMKKTAN